MSTAADARPLARDPWLDAWLPLLRERAGSGTVLELGCGGGRDTAVLVEAGLQVLGIDASAAALDHARRAAPGARFVQQDLRAPLPAAEGGLGAVVASLSLHYFDWAQTEAVVGRIHAALRQGGVLLCRLNSARDHNFGASGHPAIAPGYFLVDGEPKRFFTERDVALLFASGWNTLSSRELTIDRYHLAKVVWEIALERTTGC